MQSMMRKNHSSNFTLLGVILFLLIILSQMSNFDNISHSTSKNPLLIADTANSSEKQSLTQFLNNETRSLNETFSGWGDGLEYDLNMEAEGVHNQIVYLSEAPPLYTANETQTNITIPRNSRINSLNLTLDSIEKALVDSRDTDIPILSTPSFTIDYTNNSLANVSDIYNNSTTWLNVSMSAQEANKLSQLNITIDNGMPETFQENFTQISYNKTFLSSEQGEHNVNVSFYGSDSTLLHTELFSVFHSNETFTVQQIIHESVVLNPYIVLNSSTSPYLYFNISLDQDVYFSDLSFYYSFSGTLPQPVSATLLESSNNLPTNISRFSDTLLLSNSDPTWNTFEFTQKPTNEFFLDAGAYYLFFNASGMTAGSNLKIFTSFTTNEQSNIIIANETTPLFSYNNDIIYNHTVYQFIPSNLTDLEISATIYNFSVNLFNSSSSFFSEIDNMTSFTFPNNVTFWSALFSDSFQIDFNSTDNCRMNFSYEVDFNRTQISEQTQFITNNSVLQNDWHLSPIISPPDLIDPHFNYLNNSLSYTIKFPTTWIDIQAISSQNDILTPISSEIFINRTNALENWNFSASSNFTDIEVSVQNPREIYETGTSIVCQASVNSSSYNITLSYWNITYDPTQSENSWRNNRGIFFGYEETRNYTQETNNSVSFPEFEIPDTYTHKYIIGRFWWHNGTDAGINTIQFFIKRTSFVESSIDSLNLYANTWSEINSDFTLRYYTSGINITNANLSSSWVAGNWTYLVEDEQYFISLFPNSSYYDLGTMETINFEFQHQNFTTESISISIYILMNTSVEYNITQESVYYNQTFQLALKWYTIMGNAISYDTLDLNREIYITLDNTPILTQWWRFIPHTNENFGHNIEVEIFTDFYKYDFIGEHVLDITLLKENETIHYEPQSLSINFEVLATPCYISYLESGFFETQIIEASSEVSVKEFENNTSLVDFEIFFEYNQTFTDNPNEIIPFNFGNVYAYIFDPQNNIQIGPVYRFNSKYDGILYSGIYHFQFNVSSLEIGEYQIIIVSNTTNFEDPPPIIVTLEIIPKWHFSFYYNDVASIQEGKYLNWSFSVLFSNGTHEWYAMRELILIKIEFIGDDGNYQQVNYKLYTNKDGQIFLEVVEIPDWKIYQHVVITIVGPENRYSVYNENQIQVEITANTFQRIWGPILIICGVISIGIPFVLKIAYPYTKKTLKQSIIFRKIGEIPIIKKNMEYRKAQLALKEIHPHSLAAIKSIRIPQTDVNQISEHQPQTKQGLPSTNEKIILPVESVEMPDFRRFINRTLQDLQDIFVKTRIPERQLKSQKIELTSHGILLEQQGDSFNAILSLFLALQIAIKLDISEDIEILNAGIIRNKARLPPKSLKHLEKKLKMYRNLSSKEL